MSGKVEKLVLVGIGGIPVRVDAQYNPSSVKVSRSVTWEGKANTGDNVPAKQFSSGGSINVSFDMLLDSYESDVQDVRPSVNSLLAFVTSVGGKPPAKVKVIWGGSETTLRSGIEYVMTSITVTYKLFTPGGVPCRAAVSVKLLQTSDPDGKPPSGSHSLSGGAGGVSFAGVESLLNGDASTGDILTAAAGFGDPSGQVSSKIASNKSPNDILKSTDANKTGGASSSGAALAQRAQQTVNSWMKKK